MTRYLVPVLLLVACESGPGDGPCVPCEGADCWECPAEHDCDDGDPCSRDRCRCTPRTGPECTHEWPVEPLDDGVECTHDHCVDGEVLHDPYVGGPQWQQCRTDVTFFAMADPQYGGGAADKNTFQVNALNAFAGALWPSDAPEPGTPVAEPRGVLVAGDLTQNGRDGRMYPLDEDEISPFHEDYGLDGTDGRLRYPVYEGYGNHDFDPAEPHEDDPADWRWWYEDDPTPSVDRVAERNAGRVGLTHAATGLAGHYSWDWDNVHLVNVNLFPGDAPSDAEPSSLTRDPRGALAFLVEDLATHVGDSGRPVVLMLHYGFDAFGQEPRWWTDGQKEALRAALEGFNVVAILHGHTHATYSYVWEGYRVYNVGSPYYQEYNADGRGRFTVLRITDAFMVVYDVAWTPAAEGTDPVFGTWSDVVHFDQCQPLPEHTSCP